MFDLQIMRINECFAEDCKYNKGGKCIYDEGIDIDEDGQCLMYESEDEECR